MYVCRRLYIYYWGGDLHNGLMKSPTSAKMDLMPSSGGSRNIVGSKENLATGNRGHLTLLKRKSELLMENFICQMLKTFPSYHYPLNWKVRTMKNNGEDTLNQAWRDLFLNFQDDVRELFPSPTFMGRRFIRLNIKKSSLNEMAGRN